MPNFKLSRVQAIKEILQLYLLRSDTLNINIPKFEYQIRYDKFLKQNVVEKILQPPIKELNTPYVLFKEYSLQELKTLLYENINYYRLKPVVWFTLAKQIKSVNAKTLIF